MAQVVPIHYMGVFRLPRNFVQTYVLCYWGDKEGLRKIYWLSKQKLCRFKCEYGLGFRDLEDFKNALPAKQIWYLIHTLNSMACQVLKARYFLTCVIHDVGLRKRHSYIWRSLKGDQQVKMACQRWIFVEYLGCKMDSWPCSFKMVTLRKAEASLIRLVNIIGREKVMYLPRV